jgi:hypothetical protein
MTGASQFGADVDYAMLINHYGEPVGALGRYSPGECVGTELRRVEGRPEIKHVSTSYAERRNLTMRMSMRRFTRLTNAFSRKAKNHAYMVALYTTWYNFVRLHKTLRCTPAMAAGISMRLWDMKDILALTDAKVEPAKRPTAYKMRNSN